MRADGPVVTATVVDLTHDGVGIADADVRRRETKLSPAFHPLDDRSLQRIRPPQRPCRGLDVAHCEQVTDSRGRDRLSVHTYFVYDIHREPELRPELP